MPESNNKKKFSIILIVSILLLILFACIGTVFLAGKGFLNFLNKNEISEVINNTVLAPDSLTDLLPDLSVDTDVELPMDIDLEILFTPFWESYDYLHTYFINQPLDDEILAQGALTGLNVYLEENQIDVNGIIIPEDAPTPEQLAALAKTPNKARKAFAEYWTLWQKILYADLDENLAQDFLLQYSLREMALALNDPYTSYLDPVQFKMNEEILSPEDYEGIGAWVDTSTEYITVISPMEGSPAEAAGLKPDDLIIAIDGEDMTGVDGSLALHKVLGPAGTQVVLTILREGMEPFDVEITRATITTPSIRSEILEGQIAYLRIFSFSSNSPQEVHATLANLLAQDPVGLILDLRYNPGGYVNQVVQIASEFIDEGIILTEEYGDGTQDTYTAHPHGIALEIPMVVLVNGGSASASEILTGALQDYGRATIVGETTFGKGSVLVNIPLSNEQGSISITVAKWLSPNGHHIQDVGIEPDVIIEITEENSGPDLDPQLNKAIELLLENLN